MVSGAIADSAPGSLVRQGDIGVLEDEALILSSDTLHKAAGSVACHPNGARSPWP